MGPAGAAILLGEPAVSHPASPAASLVGRVLAAMPTLEDPNFMQTLVFVAEHHADGALGFVMNRPAEKSLRDLVPDAGLSGDLGSVPVFSGGPVQGDRVVVAAFAREGRPGRWLCRLGLPMEQLEAHLRDGRSQVRAFVGYAGWSAGQLDREVVQGSWKICRPDDTLFQPHLVPGLWPFYISGDARWRALLPHLPRESGRN